MPRLSVSGARLQRSAPLALLLLLAACTAPPAAPAFRFDTARAAADVDRLLAEHGDGVTAAIWIGDGRNAVWARNEHTPMPAASAIKTAFLIELFTAHQGALDRTLPAFATITDDASHPALAHFAPPARAEIRRQLHAATVHDVGRAMIRGTGVSNAVYNAAANVTTALLGGPAALTARIHARDAAFAPLQVRRYMLAAREAGDNEATAAGLAAPLQRIATGQLPGVDATTLAAIRAVMRGKDHARFGLHYTKGGSLDSDPMARVASGAFVPAAAPIVYVVMVRQADPAGRPRTEAGQRLGRLANALRDAVLGAVDP